MIHVTKTYFPPREKLNRYIDRIYDSGWMTNNGQLVLELESRLRDFLGVPFVVPVANGTLALQVVYRLLRIKNEVITTPFSFIATSSSLLWEHLTPVFADVDPQTFNIDTDLIEKAITPKTSAVLPVHVFGNACNVSVLEDICRRNNLKLVFDAAHAFSVADGDRNILNFGDASILSFHATKIFHTVEGGAIILHTEEQYRQAKLMINFGISDYDKVDLLGINCKMNEFQAAMGLAVLDDFEQLNLQRKSVWERYRNSFIGNPAIRLQQVNGKFSNNYSYFPVVFRDEAQLLHAKRLMNSEGISPRRYFYPSLNLLGFLDHTGSCPVSESLSNRILCLPMFYDLDETTQARIIQLVKDSISD